MTSEMILSTSAPPALDPLRHALFLDFDGTLVEIAPRPDAVVIPPGLGAGLSRLAAALEGAFAVVSGRSLPELARFLTGFDGLLVGSHGAEARGMAPPLARAPVALDAVQTALAEEARRKGLLYEPKSFGGALHYRDRPELEPEVTAFVAGLAARHPEFAVQEAKLCREIKPRGAAKDRALAALSALPVFAGRAPVFLGDDATDEPALDWAQAQGGYGVKIGVGATGARYRLDGPRAALDWLGIGG